MKVLVINNMCLKGKVIYFNYIIKRLRKIYHNLIVVDFISFKNIEKKKINILIIAGGDGSINRIINETINYNITYGIIPLGTANDFSHSLKIKNIEEAIEVIRKQNIKLRKVNMVNNNYFLYALSYGSLNKQVYSCESKKYLYKYAYVVNCLNVAKSNKEIVKIRTKNKDEKLKAKCVIITDSKFLGGFKINLLRTQKYYMFIIKNIFDLISLFISSRKYLIELNKEDEVILEGNIETYCLDGERYNGQKLNIKFSKKWIKIIA